METQKVRKADRPTKQSSPPYCFLAARLAYHNCFIQLSLSDRLNDWQTDQGMDKQIKLVGYYYSGMILGDLLTGLLLHLDCSAHLRGVSAHSSISTQIYARQQIVTAVNPVLRLLNMY